MQKTIILGSGGHAKVIVEILREAGLYDPIGCLAPEPPSAGHVSGISYVGGDELLPQLYESGVRTCFVALGDNPLRQMLMERAKELGFYLATAVSRYANVSPSASLGRGIAIMPGANIGPDTVVGDGVIVNSNASVDHDGQLEQYCHVGPGTTLAGNVTVGELAFVATGSTVIPEVTIGARSIIGAGSVVIRDLPSDVVAYGVPAEAQREFRCPTADDTILAPATADNPLTRFRLVS